MFIYLLPLLSQIWLIAILVGTPYVFILLSISNVEISICMYWMSKRLMYLATVYISLTLRLSATGCHSGGGGNEISRPWVAHLVGKPPAVPRGFGHCYALWDAPKPMDRSPSSPGSVLVPLISPRLLIKRNRKLCAAMFAPCPSHCFRREGDLGRGRGLFSPNRNENLKAFLRDKRFS